MRWLKWLALCALLLVPTTSRAMGITAAAGAGYMTQAKEFKLTGEISPFFSLPVISFLRIEVPIVYDIKPTTPVFGIGLSVKAFIPIIGLYARLGYGLGHLFDDPPLSQRGLGAIGWELSLLDKVGVFIEAAAEPGLKNDDKLAVMGRLGLMLNL